MEAGTGLGDCYIEFKWYDDAIVNFENVVQKAIDTNDLERQVWGLCSIVKCMVLANKPEKDYVKQLDEIKWIVEQNKEN